MKCPYVLNNEELDADEAAMFLVSVRTSHCSMTSLNCSSTKKLSQWLSKHSPSVILVSEDDFYFDILVS